MGKPSGLFPPPTELPFHLPHSSSTTPQIMHNCPSTAVPKAPSSLRVQRRPPEATSPPPTGKTEWKRSHHQPAFLLERLSSRSTGGRDNDSLGLQPSPARGMQGLHPPAGAPDSGGSWTSRLIGICPEGSKWPRIHGQFTDKTHRTSVFQPMRRACSVEECRK